METYKRVFVIVLDSLGIGAMPDSEKFGDKDVDTFGHILDKMGALDIPNLQKLGMLNLHKGGTMEGVEKPIGRYMRIAEASNGKDTMTGHWEMMGINTKKPFITFTETGFPKELIEELEKRCGKRVIGNKSASGTEIIEELGEEEINTGAMIVYTSADSVMQICGNEETFDLQNLYRCCEIAREITMFPQRFSSSAISSCGNPVSVNVLNGLSVLIPIISQCPVIVSLPLLASLTRINRPSGFSTGVIFPAW